jgi:hypothetical protein
MSRFVASEKDVTLAFALAAGASTSAAAEEFGVNQRTVQRRLNEPDFRQLVADLRAELMGQALGRMASNMTTRAADSLAALLDSEDERVRLRTCRALLSLGLKMRDSVDLTERVREIEAEIARKQGAAA